MSIPELHTLLSGLKNEEINSIRNSFSRSSKQEKEEILSEKLYEFLIVNRSKELDDDQIAVHVYGESKGDKLKKLKSRLFYHILDVFTSDIHVNKEGVLDPLDRHSIRLRKKMLQLRVLYRKKSGCDKSVLLHLLAEMIKEAKEYEFYDLIAEALYFKKYLTVLKKGCQELLELNKQIAYYQDTFAAVLRAADAYFDIASNQINVQNYNSSELHEVVNKYIVSMTVDYESTRSVTILYYLRQIEAYQLIQQGRHNETMALLLETIDMLKSNKCIYRTERLAASYSRVARCMVHKGEFDQASKHVRKAQSLYGSKSINYVVDKEQEFFSEYYAANYQNCQEILNELIELPNVNFGEFRQDRFMFFKASVYFQTGDLKSAMQICNSSLEITKDKSRWDLSIRFLKIMALVDLQLHDQAYAYLEALRKIIGRYKADITQRDELIYKCLNEYSRQSFGFLGSTKLWNYIEELSTESGPLAWTYYSHELVRFDKWIGKKIKPRGSSADVKNVKA